MSKITVSRKLNTENLEFVIAKEQNISAVAFFVFLV